LGEPGYPPELAATSDPPLALYVRGTLGAAPRCAIVGSRRATGYALRLAGELAAAVGEQGIPVISGLARGVDRFAHEGALRAGGPSLAVLACGLDLCYPPEHAALAERCVESGALVTEHPLGTPPMARAFPRRNRIVSGLAEVVCIVAASERSGSLTTAGWAIEQGREVFVVPHRIGDPGADGVLRLLRDGAHPVTGPADLLVALGVAPGRRSGKGPPPPRDLPPHAAQIWELLGPEALHLDDLCEGSGLPLAVAFRSLVELERLGLAEAVTAQTFRRAAR
jgi:DNA processing protein